MLDTWVSPSQAVVTGQPTTLLHAFKARFTWISLSYQYFTLSFTFTPLQRHWHATCYNTLYSIGMVDTHGFLSLINTLPYPLSIPLINTTGLQLAILWVCTALAWLTHMGFSLSPMVTPLPHQPYVIATSITSITWPRWWWLCETPFPEDIYDDFQDDDDDYWWKESLFKRCGLSRDPPRSIYGRIIHCSVYN